MAREQVAPALSPSAVTCSVEPTISVNITVASTRSGTAGGATPATNLSISSTSSGERNICKASLPLTCVAWAPGMRLVMLEGAVPLEISVEDQRWHAHGGKQVAQVSLVVRSVERVGDGGSGADS